MTRFISTKNSLSVVIKNGSADKPILPRGVFEGIEPEPDAMTDDDDRALEAAAKASQDTSL